MGAFSNAREPEIRTSAPRGRSKFYEKTTAWPKAITLSECRILSGSNKVSERRFPASIGGTQVGF